MKRLALIVPLGLFLGFVAFALFGLRQPADRPIESQMVGKTVPDFELAGLDPLNPGLHSEDLKQGTVTLVNMMASWCLPCQVEAPQLARLEEAGAVIHAIAIRDAPADVTRFLERHGDPFRRIGLDPQGRMQIAFGASGVPETYLIDGSGVIRKQYIGEIRAEQVDEILREIERLKS